MRQPGAAGTDASIVQAYLAGDRDALAALYDRFGPGLYDTARAMLRDPDAAADVVQDVFCVAAVKLGQLRDPSRVKPWLYAIARHEIYRRSKRRSRERTSLDAVIAERGDEPMAPPDPRAEAGAAISADLASAVRDAAAGLDESDQLLLELSARQGLVGADLAAALGIPAGQAHSMLFRMRERLERAVGAVVVARGGRSRCEGLAAVLAGWDGTFDVLWRKRIARHIDGCETCQETRRGAAVLSLVGAAPAFAAPAELRARTLDAAHATAEAAAGAGGTSGSAGSGGSGDGTAGGGGTRPRWRASRRERRAARRYRFDADGFPIGLTRHRSLAGPVTATLSAVLAVVLATSLWTVRAGSVEGSVGLALAPPTTTTTTTTTSTPTTTSTTTSTTTTTSTSTSTTSSTTSSTTAPTVTTAAPPGGVVGPPAPPTGASRPPTTATVAPTRPTTAPTRVTTPPTATSPPTRPPRTTTTTIAQIFVTPTAPPNVTVPVPIVTFVPVIPILTTTTHVLY